MGTAVEYPQRLLRERRDLHCVVPGWGGCDEIPTQLAILQKWTDTSLSYNSRVNVLRNGYTFKSETVELSTDTVFDDYDADTLDGAGGRDWFWFDRGDATDRQSSMGEWMR